jgi:glycosyltransferase involved in cell wall biosynthesis
MPYYFRHLHLSHYDLVISSTHNSAHHVRPRPDALHIAYCYTPMRYAWLPATDANRGGLVTKAALRVANGHIRTIDRRAARRPLGYVAISTAVQDRIRRFYDRASTVIHPPVDVEDFDPGREKEPHTFLWVHRLVPYKHPLTVAEAFRDLPYRLTMVGVGPLEPQLRATLPPNVTLRGWVSRSELASLYAQSSGFIHIGEEDFGITMVEAMASGTPVIALSRGGSLDIVDTDDVGILLPEVSVSALREGVMAMASQEWDAVLIARCAAAFSRETFVRKMLAYIASIQ